MKGSACAFFCMVLATMVLATVQPIRALENKTDAPAAQNLGGVTRTLRTRPTTRTLDFNHSDLSVSGLSAGAFMAVQFHVSYSKQVRSVGVIAGGPFWCAEDNIATATSACMVKPSAIDTSQLAFFTHQAERVRSIDPLVNLQDANVFVFSGLLDSVVVQGVGHKLVEYYQTFTKSTNIKAVFNISAQHTMPTRNFGNKCNFKGSPYISNCGYDAAFEVLSHAWPGIKQAPASAPIQSSNMYRFDQSTFFEGLPNTLGMSKTGFVYIPSHCKQGGKCRLHVAFHGCLQGFDTIGATYVTHAGYNPHAEINDIIVLYPQAKATALNPKGCFDWWGYTSPSYACQLGVQVAGIYKMITALADGRIPEPTSTSTIT